MKPIILAGALVLGPVNLVLAHPGGLAADGCHNDRKNGGRHCHRSAQTSEGRSMRQSVRQFGSPFRNCAAARAPGAAPVMAGDAGYGPWLDRDGDGIGCE